MFIYLFGYKRGARRDWAWIESLPLFGVLCSEVLGYTFLICSVFRRWVREGCLGGKGGGEDSAGWEEGVGGSWERGRDVCLLCSGRVVACAWRYRCLGWEVRGVVGAREIRWTSRF